MPGSPFSASTQSPESSASAAWRPALADASALICALAAKVAPVSSGSGKPSDPALIASMPCGPSSALISRTLPGLWEATTSWVPRGSLTPNSSRQCLPLKLHQFADTLARQFQQRHQLLFAERRAFGSTLNLHQSARAGQNKIGVGFGGRVLVVIKIKNRHSLD